MSSPRRFLAVAVLCLSVPAFPARDASADDRPRILIHLASPTTKNICEQAQLSDCAGAVTSGLLGKPYFAYVLATRGNLPDLAGVEFGLAYDGNSRDARNNLKGIDIESWTLCATLEFPTPYPAWPNPLSGNLITWNTDTVCQKDEVAVAGYFYVTGYFTADALKITPRPPSDQAAVITCDAQVRVLAEEDLGFAVLGPAGSQGCNPCLGPCAPAPAPICDVSTTDIDFGTLNVGETTEKSVTVTNRGGGVLSVKVVEDGPHFEIAGPDHYDLEAGTSAEITIRFTPAGHGKIDTYLTLTGGCEKVRVRGFGYVPANCTADVSVLDFGRADVGTETYRNLVILNRGGAAVGDVRPVISGPGFQHIGHPGLPAYAGLARTLTLRFMPFEAGPYVATLNLGACGTVELRGIAQEPSGCSISIPALEFGAVAIGVSVEKEFRLRNFGSATMTGVVMESSDDFAIVSDPAYSIPPGGNAPFTVRFSPSKLGHQDCPIDPGSGCAFLTATGIGDQGVLCSVNTSGMSLGPVAVGGHKDAFFSIQNKGGLILRGTVTSSSPEFQIVSDPVYALEHGRDATVIVRCAPLTAGLKEAIITTGSECTPVTVHAEGVPAQTSVSTAELKFGAVKVGESKTASFTIRNSGTGRVGGTVATPCGAFSVQGNASYDIAPGGTYSVTIRFAPTGGGAFECAVESGTGNTIMSRGTGESSVPVEITTWGSIKARYAE